MAEAEPAGPTRVNAVAAASAMAVVRTVFIVLENTYSLSVVSVVSGARRATRVRLQVWCAEGESVPSVVSVWPTADWHEREAYDLMGIEFEGHPNLKRILMDDDWQGHPLRKDYPIGGEPVRFSGAE